MIKHFSFTCLEVVFFPRLSKCFNHEGLSMFYIRGVASKIHPDSFRKWKSFLLITYLPPSTLHFGEKIIFGGGEENYKCFYMSHHLPNSASFHNIGCKWKGRFFLALQLHYKCLCINLGSDS